MSKLYKQVGGTIYRSFLSANEALRLDGRGCLFGGGGVQFICLVGCRLPSLDGNVSVCLVLTKEVFGRVDTNSFVTYHASNLKCPVL